MFSISEQELQDLIDKHYGRPKSKDKTPEYDLKSIVEYGLMFLYGQFHLKDGKVVPCLEKLDIYKKHRCKSVDEKKTTAHITTKFVEVTSIKTLDKTPDTLKACWTGYNLAILTANFTLQGYFKHDLLFQKKFDTASSLAACADKICIGLFSGEIIYFDPIGQNEVVKQCHTDTVTSLYYENGNLLSSSLDGSIFYRKKIQMSDSGVLDVQYVSEEKFVCSCCDHKLVFYDAGEFRLFSGHKERIKSLSYNRFGISTSRDGEVGFLFKENMFEITNLGASLHKRASVHQFFGHGLSSIFLYDVNHRQKLWSLNDSSLNLAVKDNLVVYSYEKDLRMVDMRSRDLLDVPLNVKTTELNFCDFGDILLVCTDQSPLLLDLRTI